MYAKIRGVGTTANILTVDVLPSGGTSPASAVLDFHNTYVKQLAFTVSGTYATSSATTGITLNTYYSPNGTDYDTKAYDAFSPTFAGSSATEQTVQESKLITAMPGYFKSYVVNKDADVDCTEVEITANYIV